MLDFSKFSKPIIVLICVYFASPRLAIGILWIFTQFFTPLFSDHIWMVLGIIFCPYSLLTYSIGMTLSSGSWTAGIVLSLIVTIALDFWYLFPRD